MLSMIEIKQRIEQLANQIHVPATLMPTFGYSRHDATPHIEVNDLAYYYINFERDSRLTNRKTSELDTLLYWAFVDITSVMASDYELAHRDPIANTRRAIFEHQLFLLETLSHDWKERREKEIAEILKASPD